MRRTQWRTHSTRDPRFIMRGHEATFAGAAMASSVAIKRKSIELNAATPRDLMVRLEPLRKSPHATEQEVLSS